MNPKLEVYLQEALNSFFIFDPFCSIVSLRCPVEFLNILVYLENISKPLAKISNKFGITNLSVQEGKAVAQEPSIYFSETIDT